MSSLKEVKRRIESVSSTRKITQARQMVSSAQLHRSQGVLEKAVTYKQSIDSMLYGLAASVDKLYSPYLLNHTQGAVAIVVMASNSGMCGSFNAKMEKELSHLIGQYSGRELLLFPIGRKMREALSREGYQTEDSYDHLAEKTTYEEARTLSAQLMNLYRTRQVCRVEMLYYHFKTTSTQVITRQTLLPYPLPSRDKTTSAPDTEYILEPSREELAEYLIDMCIHSDFYTALTDNQTSEHAARTVAMQIASENADDILYDLRTTFNKLRQNNITNDLLDISRG